MFFWTQMIIYKNNNIPLYKRNNIPSIKILSLILETCMYASKQASMHENEHT